MNNVMFLILLFVGVSAQADVMDDFGSLGDNAQIVERAKKLYPEKQINLIQNRVVSRKKRSELLFDMATVSGGDPYVKSQDIGAGFQWHLNPHWSLGLKGWNTSNQLSNEGKQMIEEDNLVPEIDQQTSAAYALVNWYPIYGKMNLYDLGISHFDFYLLGGLGKVHLKSGSTNGTTIGLGLAFWISQHISARLEARRESFDILFGQTNRDLSIVGFSLGYLL